MTYQKIKMAIAATALSLAAAASATVASAETVITLGHIQPPTHAIGQAATEFGRLVSERTNGEVRIQVHPSGELGGSSQLAEGVRLGTVDIIITGTPFWSRFEPMLNVMDLPYIYRDLEHARAVADSDIGRELMDRLGDHGVKGLAFYEIGFRNVTNSVRPIRTPDDIQGLKIRVSPNRAHTTAFQIMGANPVAMSFTEVYLALQTGAVDGQENPIGIIATGRLDEVQDYLSLTGHAYSNSIFAMNLRRFDSLSEEHQEIILEAAEETAQMQRQLNTEARQGHLQMLIDAGMQVIEDVDQEAFKDAVVEPVWSEFVEDNEGGQAYIDRILAVGTEN